MQNDKLSGGEVAGIAVSVSLAGVIMSKKNWTEINLHYIFVCFFSCSCCFDCDCFDKTS